MTKVPAARGVLGAGVELADIRLRINRYFEGRGNARGGIYYFRKNAAYPLRSLAGSPRRLVGFLSHLVVGRLLFVYLLVQDARVRVKHHIRVYYKNPDGRQVTVKIAVPSGNRDRNFAREIHARRLFRELAPPILDYDRKALGWFVEPALDIDRDVDNRLKLERFVRSYARDFYRTFATSRPLPRVLRKLGVDADNVEAVLNAYPAHPAVELDRSRVTCTMVHGDLSPVNMLATIDGRFFLTDFENMSAGMLALDVARTTNDANIGEILDLIRDCSRDDVLPPLEQLWVAAAIRLARFLQQTSATPVGTGGNDVATFQAPKAARIEFVERKIRVLLGILADRATATPTGPREGYTTSTPRSRPKP